MLDLGNKEEKILEKNLDCYSATLVYQPDRINLSSNILITKEKRYSVEADFGVKSVPVNFHSHAWSMHASCKTKLKTD